ncbi:MAG: DUF177 domain-containing protein [Sulfuricella sp.]|nr:DUF177 domain-containing protein [Sulfuricella sp.]
MSFVERCFDKETGKLYHARLMSEQLVIDSLEFARHGQHLVGEIAVADLPRLRDLLLSDNGLLRYRLSGEISVLDRPRLALNVSGELALECQRCLDELVFPVDVSVRLELVKDGESFIPVEEEDDSVDLISADSAMDVMALVEDEVLLCLPIAPMHPPEVCREKDCRVAPELDEVNPFKVLASLKKNV